MNVLRWGKTCVHERVIRSKFGEAIRCSLKKGVQLVVKGDWLGVEQFNMHGRGIRGVIESN